MMTAPTHQAMIYVGLRGEGDDIGAGGLYRQADGDTEWQPLTHG